MTVLRWFVLLTSLLLSAAVPLQTEAQDSATEVPTGSLVSAVSRQFNAAGMSLIGPVSIGTMVYLYDSPENAATAFPKIVDYFLHQLDEQGGLKAASARHIGDERKAYGGETTMGEQKGQAGLFAWREDNRVYLMIDGGLSGEMLTPLFDLAGSLTGRDLPDSDPVIPDSPDEMSSGGAYALLPGLDDMPPGFVFGADTDMLAQDDSGTPAP